MQIGEERILKKMLHTKMEGKRPRGRPRIRWIDQIRKGIDIYILYWIHDKKCIKKKERVRHLPGYFP